VRPHGTVSDLPGRARCDRRGGRDQLRRCSYGTLTITKAISIICDNTQAGIGAASFSGIVVNAGANDIVTLKGLDIEGAGTGAAGIVFNSDAALHVHKVQIRNFRGGNTGISGLLFQPTAYSELYVADSYITTGYRGSSTAEL
jgi:hypothetical protein